jgi:hypothetical protein
VAVTLSGALGGGPVAHLDAASARTCASSTTSALTCFGEQVDGSLGNGTNVARSLLPVAVTTAGTPLAGQSIAGLAEMSATACARTTDGVLSCWGSNAFGQLGNGNPVSEAIPAPPLWASSGPTAPGVPTITGAVRGDQQVQLTWSAPASDGGSPITGYTITPYIGAVAQTPVLSSGTGTSKAVTGLVNGTTYTFRVVAANAVGNGPSSSPSTAVTPAGVPTAPTVSSVVAGDAQVSLVWSAAGANGSSITGYVVTPYIGNVAQTSVTTTGTGTSTTITGLANGTTYTFTVAGKNGVGTGSASAASAPVTPDTPAPFASWALFVRRQHQDLTGVLPSASVESAQAASLASGSMAKGDLIEMLRTSTDNLTNVDPTARLYRAFLGRTPDPGGLKFWLGRRRSGSWTLTRIADSFATSSEFVRKYGALSNRQFVTRIYTDVLGRTADQAGVDYWTKKLDTKAKTRGGVMVGFSESNEYKRKQANTTDAAVVHIFLLGRAPSASDLATWVSRIEGGATRAKLATEVLDSAPYATRITG